MWRAGHKYSTKEARDRHILKFNSHHGGSTPPMPTILKGCPMGYPYFLR
nr:MAG TPA: hypothetical protein [Caudoviricetes sp.]